MMQNTNMAYSLFRFFPLVVMYVIIGILINRYGRGIESMPELLPNHSFWADFPFLVKVSEPHSCKDIEASPIGTLFPFEGKSSNCLRH